MNLSKHGLLLLMSALVAGSLPAQAANLNDFLTHGYHIASRTSVVGIFKGCEKKRAIQFRDKSVFSCESLGLHRAYAPTAFILETTDMPPKYAVLIDGQAYSGSLVRLAGKEFRHAAQVTATIETPAPIAPSARPLYAAMPLGPMMPKQPGWPSPTDQSEPVRYKSAHTSAVANPY